jgi:hypothetical protein
MNRNVFGRTGVLVVLLIACISMESYGQSFTGAISGTVKDSSDSVIPGATITVTNVSTGQARSGVSGAQGEFIFPGLQPGQYRLDAELEGFAKAYVSGITLPVNQRVDVPVVLEVGQLQDTVNVVGSASQINLTDATVSQVIEQKRVVELPLNGRDFVQLAMLSAGMENRQTDRGLLSTNGTRGNGVGFLFDGVDGNDANALFLSLTPSIEAIQEFNIQTSTYSAEFGRTAGAQINLVTKAGSNAFHGSVFEFFRNAALDAKNFFDLPNEPIPPFTRNQFGFVVSGPIRHNKMFFLANYEGTRMRKALTARATVPTLAERNGDFSRTFSPQTGNLIVVRDPLTGQPFPNNVIPVERLDPTGRRVVSLYPEPNRAEASQNFISSPSQRFVADLLAFRFDRQFSSTSNFFARYFYSDAEDVQPFGTVAGGTLGGTSLPGYGITIPSRGQNLALNWTQVLTSKLLLEARFGYHGYNTGRFQDSSVDRMSGLGIASLSNDPRDHGYPLFQITGYTTIGDGTGVPQGRPQKTFHYFTNLTYSSGGHNLRTGFEARRMHEDVFFNGFARGSFSFTSAFTGYGLADALLGLPAFATVTAPGLTSNWRDTTFGTFIQDDWKLSERLTLNLGLRYEFFTPLVDANDRRAVLDPVDNTLKQVGTAGIPRAGYEPDRNNFAPRFGFALLPFGGPRVVVRGGYGVFYDKENWNTHLGLSNQPLFRTTRQFERPGSINQAFTSSSNVPPPVANTFQRDFRDAYYQHWNVFLEGEPRHDLTLAIGYVGSKGSNLPGTRDINQPRPGAGTPQSRRPIIQYGAINAVSAIHSSNYHSMQARAERRFQQGLSFLVTYTLAKSIDDAPLYGGTAPDANNLAAARGPANTDSRHRLSASFIYELPFGPGRRYLSDGGGLGSALLGGWQVNGIVSLAAGVPFTPVVSQDIAGIARPNVQWPDRVCDPELDDPTPDRWFNAECFRVPAAGTFGNNGRNTLIGPGLATVDLSIFKGFRMAADHQLQFRAEIFNLLNRANFGQPNATIDSPLTVGRISTTATDSRQIQLALKYLF